MSGTASWRPDTWVRVPAPLLTGKLLKLVKAQCAGLEDVESNRTAGLGRRPGRATKRSAMLASTIQKVLVTNSSDPLCHPPPLPILIY